MGGESGGVTVEPASIASESDPHVDAVSLTSPHG
jgi:hypothetical protein